MKRRELKEFVLAVRIYRLLREEAELAALQRERQKSEVLEQNLEQMVAVRQELESPNRQLRAQVGESEITHQQVREQIKPAGAILVKRRAPTRRKILAQEEKLRPYRTPPDVGFGRHHSKHR